MKTYRVECHRDMREVYLVQAENADEAMENWRSGLLILREVGDREDFEATQEDG
jgi:hypothetical protein